MATPRKPGLADAVLCAVLNARYDLPRQVQMQLQMSGAGRPVQARWESARPPWKGYGGRCRAVTEIEV
jgi:hypothetical protein